MARSITPRTAPPLDEEERGRLARIDAKIEACLREAEMLTGTTPEAIMAEHMAKRPPSPGWYRLQYKRTQEAFNDREVF